MTKAVAKTAAPSVDITAIEQVLVQGNIASLTPEQRVAYAGKICEMMGLNPLTKPFEYVSLSGKLTLYATKGCAEQLRHVHKVSITVTSRELVGDVYVVTASARTPDGRADESTGAVAVTGLKGEALANAYMKAETKAKRRVTLSLLGLNMLDETEVQTIPGAQPAGPAQPQSQAHQDSPPARTPAAPSTDSQIPPGRWRPTEKQLKRLFAIAHAHGHTDAQIRAALVVRYNIDSTSKLSREQYDEFCKSLEKPPINDITPREPHAFTDDEIDSIVDRAVDGAVDKAVDDFFEGARP